LLCPPERRAQDGMHVEELLDSDNPKVTVFRSRRRRVVGELEHCKKVHVQ
jgi:hypothetical protein